MSHNIFHLPICHLAIATFCFEATNYHVIYHSIIGLSAQNTHMCVTDTVLEHLSFLRKACNKILRSMILLFMPPF